jgi:hypothetical protein
MLKKLAERRLSNVEGMKGKPKITFEALLNLLTIGSSGTGEGNCVNSGFPKLFPETFFVFFS